MSGEAELVFRGRWKRYLLSAVITACCLAPPVVVMFVSLNLQGYIDAGHPGFLGVQVYTYPYHYPDPTP